MKIAGIALAALLLAGCEYVTNNYTQEAAKEEAVAAEPEEPETWAGPIPDEPKQAEPEIQADPGPEWFVENGAIWKSDGKGKARFYTGSADPEWWLETDGVLFRVWSGEIVSGWPPESRYYLWSAEYEFTDAGPERVGKTGEVETAARECSVSGNEVWCGGAKFRVTNNGLEELK